MKSPTFNPKPIQLSQISLRARWQTTRCKPRRCLIEQATPLFVNWLKAINKFIDYQENLNKSVGSGVSGVVAGFQTLALGSLGGAVLMAIAAAFLATRSITLPMAKLQIALRRMAEGNNESTSDIEARSDEVGDLAKAVGAVRQAVTSQAEARAAADARRTADENARLEATATEREALSAQTNDAVCQLGQALEEMAAGNLDIRLDKPFAVSLDTLRVNFNNSVEKLQSALKTIGDNALSIDAGAREISEASNDLAKRTEQQAASIEQTAAALDEISTTVNDLDPSRGRGRQPCCTNTHECRAFRRSREACGCRDEPDRRFLERDQQYHQRHR